MSVKTTSKGRHLVDVAVTVAGEKRRRQERFSGTRGEALRRESELRQELIDGLHVPTKHPTVAEFAEDFMAYADANSKPSDAMAKRSILTHHILPALGELRIDEVQAEVIDRFKQGLRAKLGRHKKPLSPKTINNVLGVLSRMLNLAHEYGRIRTTQKVKQLKLPPRRIDFLSREETTALVDGADPEWRVMILVAARTGLRHGELLALTWDAVDLPRRQLEVRAAVARGIVGSPKNHRARVVPLSAETIDALRGLDSRLQGGHVWPGENGRPQHHWLSRNGLWRACRLAGLRKVGWHTLRHTFASQLVMAGVSIRAVQLMLGHSSVKQTERYAHLAPAYQAGAVDVLDDSAGDNRVMFSAGKSV